jgi:serine/threonine-protein kinase CTR1
LSYSDKVPDGFYLIQGMNPFIWTLCNDVHDGGRVPSIESLKAVNPTESSIEAVIVDKVADYELRQLISMAIDVSRNRADSKEIATRLAGVVSAKMGLVLQLPVSFGTLAVYLTCTFPLKGISSSY